MYAYPVPRNVRRAWCVWCRVRPSSVRPSSTPRQQSCVAVRVRMQAPSEWRARVVSVYFVHVVCVRPCVRVHVRISGREKSVIFSKEFVFHRPWCFILLLSVFFIYFFLIVSPDGGVRTHAPKSFWVSRKHRYRISNRLKKKKLLFHGVLEKKFKNNNDKPSSCPVVSVTSYVGLLRQTVERVRGAVQNSKCQLVGQKRFWNRTDGLLEVRTDPSDVV